MESRCRRRRRPLTPPGQALIWQAQHPGGKPAAPPTRRSFAQKSNCSAHHHFHCVVNPPHTAKVGAPRALSQHVSKWRTVRSMCTWPSCRSRLRGVHRCTCGQPCCHACSALVPAGGLRSCCCCCPGVACLQRGRGRHAALLQGASQPALGSNRSRDAAHSSEGRNRSPDECVPPCCSPPFSPTPTRRYDESA